jgi:hypothetical protein
MIALERIVGTVCVWMASTRTPASAMRGGTEQHAETTLMIALEAIVGTVCVWMGSTRTRALAMQGGTVQHAKPTSTSVLHRRARTMVFAWTK